MENTKSVTIMELVAGYDAYAGADELGVNATGDAPETSAPCASAGVSWIGSQFVSRTISEGC